MKNNKGVSMITLVITIILIIILALITYASSTRAIENANYSNFVSGVSEVATAFEKTSLDMNSTPMLIKDPKRMEQIYHYVAYAGEEKEDFLEYYELPAYSIMQKEMDIGMEIPEVKVESGTGHVIPIKYAATLTGKVFIWPPYEYEGKLYINQEDVVDYKLQEDIIVGGEEIKIIIDSGDGSLLDAPSGEGIYDDDYEFDDEYEDGEGEGEGEEEPGEEEEAHLFAEKKATEEYLASEATCLTPAKYYFKCINCDLKGTKTYSYGSALSHNWGAYTKTKTPTCAETGMEQRICKRCNEVESVVLPKDTKNHVGEHVQEIMREANCVETERISTKCSACNIVLSVQEGEKNLENHKGPEKTLVTKQATCTEAGTKQTRCSACDVILEVNQIEAKGHSFGNWIVTDEATCKEEGEQQRSCSSCGTSEKAEIQKDANNHKKEAVREYYTEATCTESGKKETRCTDCEVSLSTQTIAPLGHTYKAVVTAPTYEANGFTTYTCERCGDTYIGDETPKLVKVPFAIYSDTDKSLRFYNNADTVNVGDTYKNLKVTAIYKDFETATYGHSYNEDLALATTRAPWGEYSEDILSVVAVDEIKPTSLTYWFAGLVNATSIDLEKFNISNVTNIDGAFRDCRSVTSLKISSWDTSNVTSMMYLFWNAVELQNIDISNWNTQSVTTLYGLFGSTSSCVAYMKLNSLDISKWNTTNVTDLTAMFENNGSLGSLDLSKKTVTTANGTYTAWDTSNVTSMSRTFAFALNMSDLNLTGWNTSNVTTMYNMFKYMGKNASSVKIRGLSDFDVSSVGSFESMFSDVGDVATSVDLGDLSNWDTKNVTTMKNMFAHLGRSATTINIGDLSNWNTSKVTSMEAMFNQFGMNQITTFNLGNLGTKTVTKPGSLSYTAWDVSAVTNMADMFSNAGRNATIWNIGTLTKWNTGKVTDMTYMFASTGINASVWNIGDLSGWNVSKVTSMAQMFSFTGGKAAIWDIGNIANWDTSKVTKMYRMFEYAGTNSSAITLDLSGWNTLSVTDKASEDNDGMAGMFFGMRRLHTISLGKNFSTTGDGTCTGFALPDPDRNYFANATGNWYDLGTGVGYAPRSIPTNTAATYVIEDPVEVYAIYSETDNSLRFYNNVTKVNEGDTYNNLKVTSLYKDFINDTYDAENFPAWSEHSDDVLTVGIENVIIPTSTAYWFNDFKNATEITNAENINTQNVTNMEYMFSNFGYNAETLTMNGISEWNVGNVINMEAIFNNAGYNVDSFVLDVSSWDVKSVENMNHMFYCSGFIATTWSVGDLSNWNTSSVELMSSTFAGTGYCSDEWNLGNLNNWNVEKVTDMTYMFNAAGRSATNFDLDLTSWKLTSKPNISYMFSWAGSNATNINLKVGTWDTSGITAMKYTFNSVGYNSNPYSLDLSNWDTKSVTVHTKMFNDCIKLKKISLGENFTLMALLPTPSAQYIAGANGKWYNIETGVGYAPASIPKNTVATYTAEAPAEAFAIYSDEDKSLRFYKNADLGSIAVDGEYNNLSVDAIYTGFEEEQYGFEDVNTNTRAVWAPMFVSAPWNENPRYTKVYVEEKISPISTAAWFYDVQNLEYGDFSYLDTSNVTNMMDMFNNAGINVSNFEIVGLSNWDVSKVTNMSGMFQYNAINATRFILDNIWDWDISKVEDMSYMFAYSKVSNLDLTNWDTSNVINMSGMFKDCTVLRTFNGGKEIIGDANENGIIDYGDATLILEVLGGNATGEINGDVNGDGKSDSSDAVAIMRYVDGYGSTYLQAPLNFNTTKVTNMDSMFQNCSSLEVLDLVTFNTGAVTSMNNMFNGSINLEVVNLGPNFAFIGTSGYLQAQTSENVSGANGKWYNIETGTGYLPSEIPNNTAATYSAKAPEDGEFECPSCGHYGLDGYQEFCSRCNYWYGECICTICGADFSRRHDCPYAACDAGNHTYGNWVTTTAATCTSRGVQTATCSVCGTTKTQVLEKLAHSYGSYVITTAATCTTSGVKTATCNNCTATTTQTISATGHSYNATYLYDSTNHWQECSACGDKQNTGTHRYGTYTVTKAATCTSTGTKKATCTTCTKTDTQTISKTSHSYGSYVTTTAATCTTAGVKTATCNNCTATTTQTIDATGHNYSYYSSSAGDCNTQGYTKEKCSKCGDISTTYTGYGSCDYYVYSSISGTCTTISSTTYKCSECGDTYTSTGSYGSCSYYTYSSTSGTCTTRGSTTYKCSYCGDTYTSTGSYGSCSYSKTCSKSGCTYKQCSNCGSTTGSHASSCFGCSTCGGTGKISKWQSDSWKIPCEGFSGCTHAANTTFTIPYQTCRVCGIISYSAFNYCPNVRDTDHTENCSCSDPDCPDC